MVEKVRRVVIGEPESYRSEFTHVEDVEALPIGETGLRWWPVWGWDELPQLPHHGSEPWTPESFFPRAGGVRVVALGCSPEKSSASEEVQAESLRLMTAEPAGLYHDAERATLHRTDTVDIGVVVSGEITAEAEDGSRVTLGPGDVFVHNGALHAEHWQPEKGGHAVIIKIGAEREGASAEREGKR